MTPIGMRYEGAYEKAHPFDTLVEGMLRHEMVEETASLMKTGVFQNSQASSCTRKIKAAFVPHYALFFR